MGSSVAESAARPSARPEAPRSAGEGRFAICWSVGAKYGFHHIGQQRFSTSEAAQAEIDEVRRRERTAHATSLWRAPIALGTEG